MTLDEAKRSIGERVMFIPPDGGRNEMEFGTITFVDETYAFVKYSGDQRSKATNPENIIPLHK